MTKTWQPFDQECCPHCGGDAEVCTYSEPGRFWEDDDARCNDCGCPGVVNIDDSWDMSDDDEEEPTGVAYISWHDEPDCVCEWCTAHFDKDNNWIGD